MDETAQIVRRSPDQVLLGFLGIDIAVALFLHKAVGTERCQQIPGIRLVPAHGLGQLSRVFLLLQVGKEIQLQSAAHHLAVQVEIGQLHQLIPYA